MYSHHTDKGLIEIIEKQGRWWIQFGGDHFGSYHSAKQALDDLVNNHAGLPIDSSLLKISVDLSDWTSPKKSTML